jgi:hypothetical protein
MILSRTAFREGVFERDEHKCVICGEPSQDAHHIIERRLFSDGGYYLDNGASLCGKHHIEAEMTTLDADEIRHACGIKKVVLPEHLYHDNTYDKWGNIILPNGNRLMGELFEDESVQKILNKGGVLDLFVKHVKYPRTYHLPWSTLSKDDRKMPDDTFFMDREVVVTLKMDGENSSLYNDHTHARSIDSGSHPSRNWLKDLWAQMSYLLDDDMRICGENLFAKHSISYGNLPSYFMMFSIWIGNTCLSWDETIEYAGILGLETVPVIYRGKYDRKLIESSFLPYLDSNEGYVLRLSDSFDYGDFRRSVGKFVRQEFRQVVNDSHGHWISKKIERNGLAD